MLSTRTTRNYIEFIDREGPSVFSATVTDIKRMIDDLAPRILAVGGGHAESLRDVDTASARLLASAEAICRRHDPLRLLLLFRRTPVA